MIRSAHRPREIGGFAAKIKLSIASGTSAGNASHLASLVHGNPIVRAELRNRRRGIDTRLALSILPPSLILSRMARSREDRAA